MPIRRNDRSGVLIAALGFAFLFVLPAAAGTILKASCPCGYHLSFNAGGGKADFATFCAAPAYCPGSKALVILNWLDDDPKCGPGGAKPVFYNDPSLQVVPPAGEEPKSVFIWNTEKKGLFDLPDVAYRCPQCGKTTLRFSVAGYWD